MSTDARRWAGVGALGLFLWAVPWTQGDGWLETFDAMPEGSITNQPGWESVGSGAGLYAATVSSLRPNRGSKALFLGNPPTATDQRVAMYTNVFDERDGTAFPLVRLSAWVYRENMKQNLTFSFGTGEVSKVTVGNTSDGAIFVNGITTSVAWVTGRYARLVLWFDLDGTVMLDYDGTNVLPWTSLNLPAWVPRYDHVKIVRSALVIPATGSIYVDDLAVETVPAYTWAWWRFDAQQGLRNEEFTGWFDVGTLTNAPADPWRPPLWDRLTVASNAAAGEKDMYRNQAAFAGPKQPSTPARFSRFSTTDWTLEMLFFFDRNATNRFNLFLMEDDTAPAGSLIWLSWSASMGTLNATLRNNASSANTQYTLLSGAPDNRWHHLAVVKAGSKNLYTYLDYQQIPGYIELGAAADGTYSFGSNTTVVLGGFGTSAPLDDRILVDEARFSGKYIMDPGDFLSPGRPMIKDFGEKTTPTEAMMSVAGVPGRVSRIERSTNLVAWAPHETKTNTHLVSEFRVALPTASNVFFRVK